MKQKLLFSVLAGFLILLGLMVLFHPNKHVDLKLTDNYFKIGNKQVSKNHSQKIVKNKKQVMMGHADLFAQMHQEMRTRGAEKSPSYPLNYKNIEMQRAVQNLMQKGNQKSNTLKTMEVIERGPSNVAGRTRAIVVDPKDETKNTWLAGAVGGGIWLTTNAGASWENKTPNMPNLAISTMAMAPSNNDYIWAGTGEGFYNIDGIRGDGLIASFDHGNTWKQVTGTTHFGCVNRLIVDPNDENTLNVAVSSNLYEENFGRIYKTSDAGETWEIVYEEENANRIQHIIHHPSDFNVQYASVNSVGVIKSVDAGETWTPVLSVENGRRYELAVAESDSNYIYTAIEVNINGLQTAYLYKSTDKGKTWTDLTNGGGFTNWLGAQGWYDNTIAVNPYDADDVFVGGIQLWRLTEQYGGISSIDTTNTASFLDFIPWGGYNNMGIGTGIQFTSGVGLPSPLDVVDTDYSSVEMRFGPGISQMAHRFSFDGQTTAYADYTTVPFEIWDVDNNKQLMVSYLDIDASGTFNLVPMNDEMSEFVFINAIEYATDANSNVTGNNGLGFLYKNIYTLAVLSPEGITWDPDNVPEATIAINYNSSGEPIPSLEQITFGYNPSSKTGTHVDHHNLTMVRMDDTDSTYRILNGNDGGVFYSDNEGSSWNHTLNGYNTTQFYGVDKKHGFDEYIGGMQDNGTWQSPIGSEASATSKWSYRIGGDGYETSWHYTNPNLIIGGYQYNGLMRSTDGGKNWSSMASQIESGSGNAPFVTKVGKSNSDPDLVFAIGASGVWRSDNFGETWNLIPIAADNWGMTSLSQVEISYVNPQVVWAGARMSDPSMPEASLHVSTNGGISFNATKGFNDVVLGRISGLATHPAEENTAFALFSFSGAPKVLRTKDLGETWEDISGFTDAVKSSNGFPDVATYSLLVMPHNTDIIWAGTEIGLFESTDNGVSWHYAIDEFPAVSIWQMNITDDQVVMATHGRGIITVTIPELPELPVVTLAPKIESNGFDILEEQFQLLATLRSAYDSTTLFVNGNVYLTMDANTEAKDSIINYTVTELAEVEFQLISYKEDKEYISGLLAQTLFPLLTPTTEYLNTFDNESDDFVGEGFDIMSEEGFTHSALHSVHPYSDNMNINYMLRVPIVIQEEDAEISFNEIVIIEPGESGSSYPQSSFYDYVVVEASKNGKTWFPIEKGYDATSDEDWLAAYNTGSNIDEALYRKRTLNLKDKFFYTGDTILLRFRLYSDAGVTNWGWAIDSLEIQKQAVSIFENEMPMHSVYLSQNYPNPFGSITHITYNLPKANKVSLTIYDIEGKLVRSLVNNYQISGEYTVVWECGAIKEGTYFYQLRAGEFVQTKKLLIIK
jgi:photosystem II stability/assembly factor-like uncharacterized protein